ncbi:hypothetical protein [Falsiroseomonas sp.]
MTRNVLFLAIGVLAVASGAFGYWLYAERQKTGISITIGGQGVEIRER